MIGPISPSLRSASTKIRGRIGAFLPRFHVDLTTVRDPDQKVAKIYGTDGWPETYIIDRTGVIRRKIVGDPDWSNPEIRNYLKSL